MKISKMEATYVNHMGDDLSVVNAARVSFHKESEWETKEQGLESLKEGDKKLINYLAKHKHFSPFNHAFMSFRVKAPIFVARQLVKHKFMPWNEVSRRYVDDEPEFYIPDGYRKKAENVKQGSSDEFLRLGDLMYSDDFYDGDFDHVDITNICLKWYTNAIEKGCSPEMARMHLPQNMMTEWIWSGTLGAYADMLRLRLDPHTQAESREVAQMIYKKVEELFPVSIKALLEA